MVVPVVSSQQMFLDQKPLGIVWTREQDRITYSLYQLNFFCKMLCFLHLFVAVRSAANWSLQLCVLTLFSS
jgi:hypothetical protein